MQPPIHQIISRELDFKLYGHGNYFNKYSASISRRLKVRNEQKAHREITSGRKSFRGESISVIYVQVRLKKIFKETAFFFSLVAVKSITFYVIRKNIILLFSTSRVQGLLEIRK